MAYMMKILGVRAMKEALREGAPPIETKIRHGRETGLAFGAFAAGLRPILPMDATPFSPPAW